jgi:ABC-type transporter Mla subunit MlaD
LGERNAANDPKETIRPSSDMNSGAIITLASIGYAAEAETPAWKKATPGTHAFLGTSADDLAALLHRLSDIPSHEIEKLIDALQALGNQLQNAGNRIQRDIAEYAELSQQIMQLTTIISDSVKKLPRGTHR